MSSFVSATTLSANNYSLNGVWEAIIQKGWEFTISGNTGVISKMARFNDNDQASLLWNDAMNKGIVNIGTPYWRNITSTGHLTWSGEFLGVTWVGDNTKATGTGYTSCNFIMSADGLKLSDNGTTNWTHTRKQ
jgi:hypothetical protein